MFFFAIGGKHSIEIYFTRQRNVAENCDDRTVVRCENERVAHKVCYSFEVNVKHIIAFSNSYFFLSGKPENELFEKFARGKYVFFAQHENLN